jgi:MFS family permease
MYPEQSIRHPPLIPFFAQPLWRLLASRTLSVVTFGTLYNLLLVRLAERGIDTFLTGTFAATYFTSLLFTTFLNPRLARRMTVAHTFKLGLLLMGLALIGFALVENLVLWFAFQGMVGTAAGFHWTAGQSWVVLSTPEALRGRIISLDQLLSGGGYAISPLLLLVTGVSGFAPFIWCWLLVTLSLLLVISLSATKSNHASKPYRLTSNGALTVVLPLLLIGFLAGVAEDGSNTVLPIYGMGIGLPPEDAPLLVTIIGLGNLLIQFPLGQWTDRFTPNRLHRVIMIFVLLIPLGLALLAYVGTSGWMYPLLFGMGGLFGALYTLNLLLASRLSAPEHLTHIISRIASATTLGSIAGPILNGAALSISAQYGLLLGSGSVMLTAWIVYPILFVRDHGETQ